MALDKKSIDWREEELTLGIAIYDVEVPAGMLADLDMELGNSVWVLADLDPILEHMNQQSLARICTSSSSSTQLRHS